MQSSLEKSEIIKEFRRNGFNLDSVCLKQVIDFLSSQTNSSRSPKVLISKLNEIAISSNEPFGEKMVRTAIQILSLGEGIKFSTYDEIVENIRKTSIMYISPYEVNPSRFFVEKPEPQMFKFDPQQVMAIDLKRFKEIQQAIKQTLKSSQWTIGMLYEDYSKFSNYNDMKKSRLMLQNEATEIQIVFPNGFQHKYPLIPGCVYAVRGRQENKGIVVTVDELVLPTPLLEEKNTLAKQKFRQMCDNIHISKDSVLFEAKDFQKYYTIFNEQRFNEIKDKTKNKPRNPEQAKNANKCTLVFGSVKINKDTIGKIFKIIRAYSEAGCDVQCVIMMLDEGEHEEVDLKIWFKGVPTFIVPHINSEGPRLLPKVPILKRNFNATKVVTNPARFSIYGRQAQFLNIPMMKNLHEKNILSSKIQTTSMNQNTLAITMSELLFSQSSTQICTENFPKQTDYFSLREQTILFVSDKACPHMEHSVKVQKRLNKCMFVSVGNFSRDGSFVCYAPFSKSPVQCSTFNE